jgi:hypothetical protein
LTVAVERPRSPSRYAGPEREELATLTDWLPPAGPGVAPEPRTERSTVSLPAEATPTARPPAERYPGPLSDEWVGLAAPAEGASDLSPPGETGTDNGPFEAFLHELDELEASLRRKSKTGP